MRLLLAFAVAQRRAACRSRARRAASCARTSRLVDDAFQRDPEAARGVPADPRLAAARDAHADGDERDGLLGRYLPEWEHIVCRWQHVIYHTYTVDVHSIFLVEELRRLWQGKYERALPELTELMRERRRSAGALPRLPAPRHRQGHGRRPLARGRRAARAAASSGSGSRRSVASASLLPRAPPPAHVARRAAPRPLGPEGDRRVRARRAATARTSTTSTSRPSPTSRASLEGGLDRVARRAPARALRAHRRVPRERARTTRSARSSRSSARVERAQGAARAELRALGVAESRIEAVLRHDAAAATSLAHAAPDRAPRARAVLAVDPEKRFATAVREHARRLSRVHPVRRGDVHGLYADVAGSLTAARHQHPRLERLHDAHRARARGLPRDHAGRRRGGAARSAGSGFERVLEQVLAGEQAVAELIAQRRRPVGAGAPAVARAAAASRSATTSRTSTRWST